MLRWLLALGLGGSLLFAPAAFAEDEEDDPTRRFTVRVQIPELEVASQGDVEIIVEANNEYFIDKQFAAEMKFLPEVGDTVLVARKQTFTKKDALYADDGKSMTWTVEVTAKKRGEHPVSVDAKFRVCDEDGDCHESRHKMRFTLIVKG